MNSLEANIQVLGRALFAQAKTRQHATVGGWWKSKLIDYSLQDPALKLQLFRFVDVLPALADNTQVGRHLNEYFNAPDRNFSRFIAWGASLAGHSSIAASLAAGQIRRQVEGMARTFIAGENPAEAVAAASVFRKKNLAVTLDMLGEAVVSEPESDDYLRQYLEVLDALARAAKDWPANPQLDDSADGPVPRVNLSVKLSSLYSQLEPSDVCGSERGAAARLTQLFDAAMSAGAFINVDMEDYRLKDLTLRIFKTLLSSAPYKRYPHFGIVLQAYLKDTERDLRELAEWSAARGTPVTVRLVKGAYWDYEGIHARQHGWPVPVFEDKRATDAAFERCSLQLLQARPHLRAAFGSHNVRSIAAALAQGHSLGLPKNALEIQGLYGMADPIKEALAADGYRVRVYAPFGGLLPGMAYLVRRLLENTANESFLRQGFVEGASEVKLLANPAEIIPIPEEAVMKKSDEAKYVEPVAFVNEPDSAFLTDSERDDMQQALLTVRKHFGKLYPLVIGGVELPGAAGEIESLNPSNPAEMVGRAASASGQQADDAVAAALKAFPQWRDTPVKARADILHKAAALMRRRKLELCAWMVFEAGKPWREADGDVSEAIDFLEYYAYEAQRLLQPVRRTQVPAEMNDYFHQPRGVAAVIAPWNFPLAILTGMTAAALATGNTVVMKPAEATPIIAAQLMRILQDAGLPAGVANFLSGAGKVVGARLVMHPDVNLIAFTGGRETGLWILGEAAKTRAGQQGVKRVICEMGGKNAIIVDEDADLDEAVLGVVQSAFGYAGQKCSACSRVIVIGTAYEPFVKRLIGAAKSLKISPAEDPGCKVPPVIDARAFEKISKYIELGKSEATLALGEKVTMTGGGYFIAPHIFTNVPPHARIAQEEIFGPVLCVLKAADFSEALKLALDVPFALTGGVYSRSPRNLERARREFRVGNLYLNRGSTGAKVCRQPFGGFKFSGVGSQAGGPEYLLQFLEPRTVTENTLRRGFAEESSEFRVPSTE